MAKVLLIIPRVSKRYPPDFPHAGIGYLAAVLVENQIPVRVLDMALGYSQDVLLSTLESWKPTLVGITSTSYGFRQAYELIAQVKSRGDHRVVIGGAHSSAIGSQIMAESMVDFAVRGEGEFTLPELCRALDSGTSEYGSIQGLIWRHRDEVVENAPRPFNLNLDSLPFPAYELFELEKYFGYKDRGLPVVTSRGCPYQCVFCSIQTTMGRRFRARSAQNVVDELEHWYDQGWRTFDFQDDNFTLDMDRAKEICDLIVARGLKITWTVKNGVRANRLDQELVEKMRQAGCVQLSFGVESGNPQVLKEIKKGLKLEQVRESLAWTKAAGIKTTGFFMVGHPTETMERFLDTVRFARSLPFDQINFTNVVPYPGTPLFEWVKGNGTFLYPLDLYLDEISYWDDRPIFETPHFSAEERRKAFRIGHSLEKKSVAQFRMGRVLGYIGWRFSEWGPGERFALWFLGRTRLGRNLYRLAQKTFGFQFPG